MTGPSRPGDLVEWQIEGTTHRSTVWASAPDGKTYVHAVRDPHHVITVREADLTVVRRYGADHDEPAGEALELDLTAGGGQ